MAGSKARRVPLPDVREKLANTEVPGPATRAGSAKHKEQGHNVGRQTQENKEGTSHLAKMLVGYVRGSGYVCKIKPHAFAAASIADKHSK